jgi:hypothetical protein
MAEYKLIRVDLNEPFQRENAERMLLAVCKNEGLATRTNLT